jgi:hypothetical protein
MRQLSERHTAMWQMVKKEVETTHCHVANGEEGG